MAVLAGKLRARRSDCAPLAGKSTLNRLEHAPIGQPGRYHKIGHDQAAIEKLPVDIFLQAHARAPKQLKSVSTLPLRNRNYCDRPQIQSRPAED